MTPELLEAFLKQEHIDSLPGEVIGNAGTHHTSTNNENIGSFSHNAGLLSDWYVCCIYATRVAAKRGKSKP